MEILKPKRLRDSAWLRLGGESCILDDKGHRLACKSLSASAANPCGAASPVKTTRVASCSGNYWSTTENNNNNAWNFNSDGWNNNNKTNSNGVRPVLAYRGTYLQKQVQTFFLEKK